MDLSKLKIKYEDYTSKKIYVHKESTKLAFVNPFLKELNYDLENLFIIQGNPKINGEFIDYAIYKKAKPFMIFDVRKLNDDVNIEPIKLKVIFDKTPSIKVAIMTNGIEYLFFTDNVLDGIMNETPFMNFNILQDSNDDVEDLYKMINANNIDNIEENIKSLNEYSKLKIFIKTHILELSSQFKEIAENDLKFELTKETINNVLIDLLNTSSSVNLISESYKEKDYIFTLNIVNKKPKFIKINEESFECSYWKEAIVIFLNYIIVNYTVDLTEFTSSNIYSKTIDGLSAYTIDNGNYVKLENGDYLATNLGEDFFIKTLHNVFDQLGLDKNLIEIKREIK